MKKPRIRKMPVLAPWDKQWSCTDGNHYGNGMTPTEAYYDFLHWKARRQALFLQSFNVKEFWR